MWGLFSLVFAAGALAQYPAKPVTVVVGFEPGGGTDTTARIVAPALGELLGQQVVVENRAGAGGNIAVDYVAKQAPDGYTMVLANVGALAVNPHILKTPYDPLKDLAPISMASVFPNVLVVQPSLSVKTVQDYVKLAKEKPGITYASSGIGGAGHLAGELLKLMSKIDIVHVPYKGGGPAMQGFLGGQVDSFFATPTSSGGQVKAGKARAIATTGTKRAALMPDVPTVAESGYPGFDASLWLGFFAPARTPQPIIERLHKEIVATVSAADTREALDKAGAEAITTTPAELAAMIKDGVGKYAQVVKAAGVKPE